MPQAVEALEKAIADVTEFTTLPVAGKFGFLRGFFCGGVEGVSGTTHVLQSETGGITSVGTKRSAHLTEPEVVTVVRRLTRSLCSLRTFLQS